MRRPFSTRWGRPDCHSLSRVVSGQVSSRPSPPDGRETPVRLVSSPNTPLGAWSATSGSCSSGAGGAAGTVEPVARGSDGSGAGTMPA